MKYKVLILIISTMGLFNCSTTKQVKKLFSESKKLENQTFHYEQLSELPGPVKAYFRYALEKGQPYLSQLRLKHTGRFKTGVNKGWIDIKGEQYFTAHPPGFLWIGKTKAFKATDSYVSNQGNLSVYLFGFLRIVNSKGKTMDQAELLRWLGESVWMPTNLLLNDYISWSAIDDSTAKLTMNYSGISVYYDVHFNDIGQITKLETERYMDDAKKKWIGKVDNYQKINGMMLPTSIKASWILEDKQHTYADFHVTEFEFNNPNKY